jgi:hypothetical protein
MKKPALIAALLLAASPAAAQVTTSMSQQESALQGGQPVAPQAPAQAPTTGVFCIEEITATFCNVPTGPNTGGYGSSGGSGPSGSAGAPGGNTSSLPPARANRRSTNYATEHRKIDVNLPALSTPICSVAWDFIRGANASRLQRRSGARAPNQVRFSLPRSSLRPDKHSRIATTIMPRIAQAKRQISVTVTAPPPVTLANETRL